MTGLLGGGHALWWDGSQARLLDCFVSVPSRLGEMQQLPVPFGEEVVHYAIGPASCAVPGLPAGLEALWRAGGRLPWARLAEPALRLARDGRRPAAGAHAACLAMLAPVMTLGRGAELYAPNGELLRDGDVLRPARPRRGARGARRRGRRRLSTAARSRTALLDVDGIAVSRADLDGYEVGWTAPVADSLRR